MERKIWKWSCKTGMDWIRFNQLFTPFGLVTHILLLCILYWINPCSLKQAKMGAQQWRTAQESLLNLEKNNVAAVDSIVRYVLSRNIIKVSQSRWFMCFFFFWVLSPEEEWKPIRTYMLGFLLLCQLRSKMQMLQTAIFLHLLTVSILILL